MFIEKKFPIFLKVLCERQPTTVIIFKKNYKNLRALSSAGQLV